MPVIKINNCLTCETNHEWLLEGMTLKELREIKRLTGLNAVALAQAGDDGDPDAIAAIVYVLHKRDKITVPFDDVDLNFADFSMVPTEQELAEQDELEKRAQRAAEKGMDPKAKKT